MATAILSHHSSNPFEPVSSDSYNNATTNSRLRRYNTAKTMMTTGASSDDLSRYYSQEGNQTICTAPKETHSKKRQRTEEPPRYIDLDEDSEDELIIMGPKPKRLKPLPDEDAVRTYDQEACDGGVGDDDSDMSDASGEIDEEMTIHTRPPEERQEILEEIANLEETVPQLNEDYRIVDRLGTGTFSSVYKAVDLHYHDKWDNMPWHGYHPPTSSAHYQSIWYPPDTKAFVAIKRIYVTSNPERIRNEISILEDCRGCRHVSQLITAFRERDQVVVVMPYQRNVDFRDYYRSISMAGIKSYLRCMFRALRDVHARRIIHRDVKPANFLFDPATGIGTLCDFGLASRIEPGHQLGTCLHAPASAKYPHGRLYSRAEYDLEGLKKMQREARMKSTWASEKVGYLDKDHRPHSKANRAGTRGFRAPEVLLKCGDQTGGKHRHYTLNARANDVVAAIDVWSAGMILLFFLTEKFPLFQSNDDIEALMEIASIIGRRSMEKAATLHSRTFTTNVPSITPDGITWQEFVEKQNSSIRKPRIPNPRLYPYSCPGFEMESAVPPSTSSPNASSARLRASSSSSSPSQSPVLSTSPNPETHLKDLTHAYDFLNQTLRPDSTQRITPRNALHHPFLAPGPDEPMMDMNDDDYFPHPFGEGVCGELHSIDAVTDERCIRIDYADGTSETIKLLAGEGIAIGNRPCEFHTEVA